MGFGVFGKKKCISLTCLSNVIFSYICYMENSLLYFDTWCRCTSHIGCALYATFLCFSIFFWYNAILFVSNGKVLVESDAFLLQKLFRLCFLPMNSHMGTMRLCTRILECRREVLFWGSGFAAISMIPPISKKRKCVCKHPSGITYIIATRGDPKLQEKVPKNSKPTQPNQIVSRMGPNGGPCASSICSR